MRLVGLAADAHGLVRELYLLYAALLTVELLQLTEVLDEVGAASHHDQRVGGSVFILVVCVEVDAGRGEGEDKLVRRATQIQNPFSVFGFSALRYVLVVFVLPPAPLSSTGLVFFVC